MTTVTVTIGWTKSDMDNGYSSFSGYRPGAEQHTETIEVEVGDLQPSEFAVQHIAEAVFAATNDPSAQPDANGRLHERVLAAIAATGYRGQEAHYSLSVGDTVTVGEVTLACASFGWDRVVLSPVGGA